MDCLTSQKKKGIIKRTQPESIAYREGDIVMVNIDNGIGNQQNGLRPAVIVSNNVGNMFSNTVKVIPATTRRSGHQPTHAFFKAGEVEGLDRDTTFLAESSWVVNKFQIMHKIGRMTNGQMLKIANAMAIDSPLVIKAFLSGIQDTEAFRKIIDCEKE